MSECDICGTSTDERVACAGCLSLICSDCVTFRTDDGLDYCEWCWHLIVSSASAQGKRRRGDGTA